MTMNSPPLVPTHDYETYLVVDEISKVRIYREVVADQADKETVIEDIASGQYERPVRIVAFNTAEGWSRDATEDVAREMLDRAARKTEPLSKPAQAFIEWATGDDVPAHLIDG
jgi:hypothetical protein